MELDQLEQLKKENKYLLLDFYADWCMPCKMQSEIIVELIDKKIDGLYIQKINVDDNELITDEFKIVSIPTLILFKDGEIVKRYVGVAKLENILSWM